MKKPNRFFQMIPRIISSTPAICIYLFLFFYLVVFAFLCMLVPALGAFSPSADVQLILGNYTNVLSALGASIAAGTGAVVHKSMKSMHEKHDNMQRTIDELHAKIDRMQNEQKKTGDPR